MKIATWNVNSIRTRLEQVVQWLQENTVDVLCLQETKVVDDKFPRELFEQLGYYVYVSGQKSYNGVALISRIPLGDVTAGFTPILRRGGVSLSPLEDIDEQKRVISGVVNGIRIINLYVPNGAAVGSDKYNYKLQWLKVLQEYIQTLLVASVTATAPTDSPTHPQQESSVESNLLPITSQYAITNSLSICGDFNIALEDKDIHDPVTFKGSVMASEPERQALREILQLGLADAFRKFTIEGGHYSWWDYRNVAFRRNRGWRIDHHYLTPDLYQRATSCTIDVAPRKLTQPSDHTPVILTLLDASY